MRSRTLPPTVTSQEQKTGVRNGKPFRYDPPELKAARQKFTAHLAGHTPPAPFSGPLRLMVKWLFPIPATGNHQGGDWKTSKPDTDNLEKLLKDCMTKTNFWPDDALVCSEIIEKFWAVHPGIFISIDELGARS